MRLTKYTHACVRVDNGDAALVIDPGGLSEAESLDGIDAVLITHEHFDHLDVEKLTSKLAGRADATVYAHPDVVGQLDGLDAAVQPVRPGETFTAAGMRVTASGGRHAVIHSDIPRIANVGYLIEERVFHPGDSVDPSDLPEGAQVETLFLPVNAPWLKLSESVEFVRAVAPRRAYALHDFLLSQAGLKVYGTNIAKLAGCDFERLEPGSVLP